MIAALSMSMTGLFKDRGDSENKRMRIAMPCNIRWKHYETADEVKLENRFAPMALKIDLESDAHSAIEKTKLVSG